MIDLAASIAAAGRQNACGAIKITEDLLRYEKILAEVDPDVIVETGTFTGRSALWFAERAPRAMVLTIDYDEPPRVCAEAVEHLRVLLLRGDSVDPTVVQTVTNIARLNETVLVVLDSDHSADHVCEELKAYGSVVTPGSYIVVEDTICRWLTGPIVAPYVGTPYDAVEAWLPSHPEFVNDDALEDLYPVTQHPGGWLKRLR